MHEFNFLKNRKETAIILGETHGIKENVIILKKFVEFYLKQNKCIILAFEWPKKLTTEINKYLCGKNKKINWEKWEFIAYNDGRISREHIKFLGWLKIKNKSLSKKLKVHVYCFDERGNTWNKRDKQMARNLFFLLKKNSQCKIVMIMGNLHARKKKFLIGREKYIPLASYLPEKCVISFKLKYVSGYFFNFSLKKIKLNKKEKLMKSFLIKRSRDLNFDYEIIIQKAHPITKLKNSNLVALVQQRKN